MTSRLALIFATIVLAAGPAPAQTGSNAVFSDLNNDGTAEHFLLVDTGEGSVDLQINNTGGPDVIAENIAWKGGIGQTPELELAPNGSVRLISMNESIGRNRWHNTLTIAWRDGAYRVAGYTYGWYDTLDPTANGLCDLNLLTGRGLLSKNGGPDRSIRTDWIALPVTEWNENFAPPEVCEVD